MPIENGDTIQVGGDQTLPALTCEQFVDGLNQMTGQNYKYEGFEEFLPEPDSVTGPADKAADDMKNKVKDLAKEIAPELKAAIERMKNSSEIQTQGMANSIKRVSEQMTTPIQERPSMKAATASPQGFSLKKDFGPPPAKTTREISGYYESDNKDHKMICADDDTQWLLINGSWIELKRVEPLPPLPQPNKLYNNTPSNMRIIT